MQAAWLRRRARSSGLTKRALTTPTEMSPRREAVGELERVLHHAAEGPDHDIGALAEDLGMADGEGSGLGLDLYAGAGAARVADEAGAGEVEARVQHVDEFVLVLGLHDRGVGHAAEIGEVEEAVVRGAVVGREAGAIHAEGDRQVLQRDVVNDLIVGALEEGRVNRADGAEALGGEAGGEEHGVLLGDADIEELLRAAAARCERPVPLGMAPVMPRILASASAKRARAGRRRPDNWAECRARLSCFRRSRDRRAKRRGIFPGARGRRRGPCPFSCARG
jgi:hypothetical protein